MKYDDVIKNKYVYDTLLASKEDANAKPRNHFPMIMPRRKNLDFTADIPNASEMNIQLDYKGDNGRAYHNTSVEPLYSMKTIGHDVY